MNIPKSWPAAAATCVILITACGSKPAQTPEAAPSPPESSADAPPVAVPEATDPTTEPLSLEDIDRWQKGMLAELEAIQAASKRLDAAKDESEKLDALGAAIESGTTDAGARGAGLSTDRYRFVRSTLSSAVAELVPVEERLDVKAMPESMIAELKAGRDAALAQFSGQIPPAVMDALRPRVGELRKLDVGVTDARLKTAARAR